MRTQIKLCFTWGFSQLLSLTLSLPISLFPSLPLLLLHLFLSQSNKYQKCWFFWKAQPPLCLSFGGRRRNKTKQNLKQECEVLRISRSEGCESSVGRTIRSQSTATAAVIYSECVRCIRVALMAQLCPKKITACQRRARGPGSVARRRLAPHGISSHAKLKRYFSKHW